MSGGGLCLGGISVQGVSSGGLYPGGLCLGVSVQGRGFRGETPPYGNEWAVRILLECILVPKNTFTKKIFINNSQEILVFFAFCGFPVAAQPSEWPLTLAIISSVSGITGAGSERTVSSIAAGLILTPVSYKYLRYIIL